MNEQKTKIEHKFYKNQRNKNKTFNKNFVIEK